MWRNACVVARRVIVRYYVVAFDRAMNDRQCIRGRTFGSIAAHVDKSMVYRCAAAGIVVRVDVVRGMTASDKLALSRRNQCQRRCPKTKFRTYGLLKRDTTRPSDRLGHWLQQELSSFSSWCTSAQGCVQSWTLPRTWSFAETLSSHTSSSIFPNRS